MLAESRQFCYENRAATVLVTPRGPDHHERVRFDMAIVYNTDAHEIWKPVPSWEGVYSVSNLGRIRSECRARFTKSGCKVVHQERILKPEIKNGYQAVHLKDSGRKSKEYVHRLVCRAFHGEPEDGKEVAHNDGSKSDNSANNLRWATRQENIDDQVAHGTRWNRENGRFTKIDSSAAQDIRLRHQRGEAKKALARAYGVRPSTIRLVLFPKGRTK